MFAYENCFLLIFSNYIYKFLISTFKIKKNEKLHLFTTTIVVVFFLLSCKNDEPKIQENMTLYSQFNVGNYWVYQDYRIDSSGIEKPLKSVDSVYISKDTLINNVRYFVFNSSYYGTSLHPKYQRDSLGYIVNEKGAKLFSISNFTDYIFTDKYDTSGKENSEYYNLEVQSV